MPQVLARVLESWRHRFLGLNPAELGVVNMTMDKRIRGHPYVKSALDMACCDILGKATNQSVCALLGGRQGESVALYRAISQDTADKIADSVARYRDEGYIKFQLKVGGAPDIDIARIEAARQRLGQGDVLVADANTGWLAHQALRIADAVRSLDVYIEQPCLTYEECLAVRNHPNRPFILNEVIDVVIPIVRGFNDNAMDVVNLKISKLGGLTRARETRDLCASLGIAMTIEDSWGGDITTAAIAHPAHSTPEALRFSATDFNSYVTVRITDGAPERKGGVMVASDAPGLGIVPRRTVLGDAVVDVHYRRSNSNQPPKSGLGFLVANPHHSAERRSGSV